jgi:hypothetical protein
MAQKEASDAGVKNLSPLRALRYTKETFAFGPFGLKTQAGSKAFNR